jgi:hypothetical protein
MGTELPGFYEFAESCDGTGGTIATNLIDSDNVGNIGNDSRTSSIVLWLRTNVMAWATRSARTEAAA